MVLFHVHFLCFFPNLVCPILHANSTVFHPLLLVILFPLDLILCYLTKCISFDSVIYFSFLKWCISLVRKVVVGSWIFTWIFRRVVSGEREYCVFPLIKFIVSLNGFVLYYNSRNTVCNKQIALIFVIVSNPARVPQ